MPTAPADFANETLRDPAALVVLAQIGIVLDLDFQFPCGSVCKKQHVLTKSQSQALGL